MPNRFFIRWIKDRKNWQRQYHYSTRNLFTATFDCVIYSEHLHQRVRIRWHLLRYFINAHARMDGMVRSL